MNKFVSFLVVSTLLGSSSSVLAVKYSPNELSDAGFNAYQCKFTRAWYNSNDKSNAVMDSLDETALRALSYKYQIDLFDSQNMKGKVTVKWTDADLSFQGSLDLDAKINNIVINKDRGIKFKMKIQEGTFLGEAEVTLSEKALTSAGKNFLKSKKSN